MRPLPSTSSSSSLLVGVLVAVLAACWPAAVAAQVTLPSAELPPESNPPDCNQLTSLYSGGGAAVSYSGSFQLSNVRLECFQNVQRDDVGDDERETFDAVLEGLMDDGSGPVPVMLTGPVETIVGNRSLSTTGLFDAEIVSMSLSGSVGGNPVAIRESASRASVGETSVTDLGGGLYHIDSFFDVFTELSVDGGDNWMEGGVVRMLLVPAGGSGVLDHYKCYKIKDPQKLKAIVDLDSPQMGLEEGCTIKKATKFCVPVMKTVVESSVPGIVLEPGQELVDDRICYKMRCGPTLDTRLLVEDQFGRRAFDKFKPAELCTPARKIVD